MKLLSRGKKIGTAEFSRDFYNRFVFCSDVLNGDSCPDPNGGQPATVLAETTQRLICEAVPSFANVSLSLLKDELLALRLEMIGTAWTHASKTEAALANSEFTKRYLRDIGRSDLWEIMGEYNHVVADSVTYGIDPNTRLGAARIVFMNSMRINLAKKYATNWRDRQAIARVVNRFDSETSWKKGIAQPLLAIQLMRRVDFECIEAVANRLTAVSFGFYQGAKEALEGVKLSA